MRRILTRFDKLLIAGLVAAALLGLGILRYGAARPGTVVVQVNGEEVKRSSLFEDQRFAVDGPLGKTEIEIRDRRVRVVDSPCGRKTCVRTGWIDRTYQSIICMPNRVVISLTGSGERVDGITG